MFYLQTKKFALIDYEVCNPYKCDPDNKGVCVAAKACSKRIIEQIDGHFEAPIVYQDMCLACGDCVDACPLNAIKIKYIN